MKCLKKYAREKARVIYTRVEDQIANDMVKNNGWEYCSKEEYKKMTMGGQDHG